MRFAVLLKWVPDLVEDLEVDDEGTGVDTEDLKFKLNEFDDHALEQALLLAGEGDEVVALTLEGDGAEKMLCTAIAKGASRGIRLTGSSSLDTAGLADSFSQALGADTYDLILTGVQSVDDRDGQLGPVLAARMGLPCVSVVSEVGLEGSTAMVAKEYSGGMVAEFEVDLPAVLGIQAASEAPRYAPVSRVRQVQQTVDLEEFAVSGTGASSGSSITGMAQPESGGGAKMLTGLDELVEVLNGLGVT
ncbi:MAG: hypothetical protein QGH57_05215 [Candidatus Thalassarchaeaceae archaeon]|jgi:electron transfer flavoprotein beta subunit|nr:electron transfer flavoprotein subunit alpha [Euryarchaeota archaeon]MDP7091528.1 hypothetical protein [Candidatus Thalassarchaeaceae archaeon]MDP7257407.1 hypothetical protein [Candidatus Thalassarchaeaceae archaeon]HJL54591.1 hypothetical protein [Candidatus Thalassarchaeaceae archaeon]HJO84632.1 hypothetical protein [Candidatus Thalassarchaeaceae archaeon]|tara:strand:- start:7661 stop:8401 length:741 start_codon:yes stop_codon:yes gene_type:complete